MDFNQYDKYLLGRAFKTLTNRLSAEKNLNYKEIAAKAGIGEILFSKLRGGKQDVENIHIEKIEAVFPGFSNDLKATIDNRKPISQEAQDSISIEVAADVAFLKKQLELWQMMYFQKLEIPEEDREAYIKKITGQ
jgi:hypothetical protein